MRPNKGFGRLPDAGGYSPASGSVTTLIASLIVSHLKSVIPS